MTRGSWLPRNGRRPTAAPLTGRRRTLSGVPSTPCAFLTGWGLRELMGQQQTIHIRGKMGDTPRNLHQDDDEERLARADAIVEERQPPFQQGQGKTAARPTVASRKPANDGMTSPAVVRRVPRKDSVTLRKPR